MDYLIYKEKAIENIEAAQICFEMAKYNASVNRAYYAMFHIAIAILSKAAVPLF